MKVNLIIIGVGKCGTTSLARWLGAVDTCCCSEPKETGFFSNDDLYKKGTDWYHKTFYPHYQGEPVVLEATPSYVARTEKGSVTAARIYDYNPDTRLIMMVRDPWKRCISAWKMWASLEPADTHTELANRMIDMAKKGFNAWLSNPEIFRHLCSISRYGYLLDAWSTFPRENLRVVFLEELQKNKETVLQTIAQFAGCDYQSLLSSSTRNYNTGNSRSRKTGLGKFIEGSYIYSSLKKYIPKSIKTSVSRSRLINKPVAFSSDTSDVSLKEKFLDEIRTDNQRFLKRCGKPENYWDLN